MCKVGKSLTWMGLGRNLKAEAAMGMRVEVG